jgi:hypothetical protein
MPEKLCLRSRRGTIAQRRCVSRESSLAGVLENRDQPGSGRGKGEREAAPRP